MNSCPTCGGVMDVTACAPYSKVVCPACSTPIRVRTDFDHFTLRKQIGEGGMSRVFLALDRTLNREAALKILNPDLSKQGERIQQFEREARITAAISHPNVVKVFSVGNDQGHFFIAMELVPGGSLDERIARTGKIGEEEVLAMAEQLALGLKAAHDAGLIHRDMKPGNILFSQEGTAKVVDFGLALMVDQEDENKEIWATPYYVPPEKLHKKPEDFRSDIYSLGASLFHALAGKPPYMADTASLEELKAIKDKPVSLELFAPDVSSETCSLIDRMMARKPNDRYKDYKELIEHIRYARQACHDAIDPAVVARRTQKAAQKSATRNAIVVTFAVALLTIVGVLTNHFVQLSKRNGDPTLPEPGEPPFQKPFAPNRGTSQKFLSAREAMFAGDFEKAREAFGQLSQAAGTKQPTLNWARFNAGLCGYFLGQARVAAVEFQQISTGPDDATSEDLEAFFSEVAAAMSSPLPVPITSGTQYSGEGTESLALLAFGLKNWEAGYFEEATEFFDRFRKADPGSADAWVNDYKGLLDKYDHDIALVRRFPRVQREPTVEQARSAVEKGGQLLKRMRSGESVRSRFGLRVTRMEKLLERLEREDDISEQARLTALREGEARRLRELRNGLAAYAPGYRFQEAIQMAREEEFTHPEIKQAAEDLLYLYEYAEEFLETLVADINKFGYTGAVERIGATPLEGEITSATRDELAIQIGTAAKSSILVSRVPASNLIKMAHGYLFKYQEMTEHHPRHEMIVVFAHVTGSKTEEDLYGKELLDDLKPFRKKWERIMNSYKEF